jgi:ubiquinone/menaquinone biosynthesis C-methylase UbiE
MTAKTDSKTLSRERYARFAAGYVTSRTHAQGAELDRLVDIARPQPDWTVLDVATGGGHTALKFAPLVAHVVATDLTPAMLEKAEAFIADQGVRNVSFKVADAEDLPFDDGRFDLLTCRVAVHHFPEPLRFVRESARVLRAGGLLLVQDHTLPEDAATARYVDDFERLRDPSHNRAFRESEWVAMLEAQGFRVEHAEQVAKRHSFLAWAERQGCTPETIQRLVAMMEQAPPAALAWMRPRNWGTPQASFANDHLIIAGRNS